MNINNFSFKPHFSSDQNNNVSVSNFIFPENLKKNCIKKVMMLIPPGGMEPNCTSNPWKTELSKKKYTCYPFIRYGT